jgi:hypothetical protein
VLKNDGATVLTIGQRLKSRPWLGVGYDVLAFDFEQAQQPLVAATFKKRWTDANASWARMVDPSTFWDFNTSRFVKDYAALFRDTTNTSLFWTQWAEGQWQPTGGLPNPGNVTAVAAWAGDRAAFVSSLVVAGNVSNLEYYCFSNEEEDVGPGKGWPGPQGNTSNFITYNRAVRKALDDIGGAVGAVKLVGTVRVFGRNLYWRLPLVPTPLHLLEASRRVTHGTPLACPLLFPVHTVNCVKTLKAPIFSRARPLWTASGAKPV